MPAAVEHVCNACGTAQIRVRATLTSDIDGQDYQALTCRTCGLVFCAPMPVFSYDDLQTVYDQEYTSGQRDIMDRTLAMLEAATHRQMEIVERYVKPGTALNVGAMSGAVRILEDRGWDLQLVDVSAYAAETARSLWNLRVAVSRIEDFDVPRESFDFIKLGHVIEHVTDPKAVIQHLSALLKPGGVLLLDTDNSRGVKTLLETGVRRTVGEARTRRLVQSLTHKNLAKRYGRLTPPEHLYVFCESSLRHLLDGSDLAIRQVIKPAWGDPTWFPLADTARFSLVERMALQLDQVGARFGYGDVVVVLAQKV